MPRRCRCPFGDSTIGSAGLATPLMIGNIGKPSISSQRADRLDDQEQKQEQEQEQKQKLEQELIMMMILLIAEQMWLGPATPSNCTPCHYSQVITKLVSSGVINSKE